MFCKHCGQELSDNSAFCESCGKPTRNEGMSAVSILNWLLTGLMLAYIILLCTNWFSVDINLGYGVGGSYDVGLFTAVGSASEIGTTIRAWSEFFRDDVMPIMLFLYSALFILFFIALAEIIWIIVCLISHSCKVAKSSKYYHPINWSGLCIIPLASIIVPWVVGGNLNYEIEHMFSFSISPSSIIMLVIILISEFIIDNIGSKYEDPNKRGVIETIVNLIRAKASTSRQTSVRAAACIPHKANDNMDKWECHSCGRLYPYEHVKCMICGVKRDDCIK